MKKQLALGLLICALFTTACAKLRLTVRNDRATPIKEVEVKVGDQRYVLPLLAAGAEDQRELKMEAAGKIFVNFQAENGGLYYTASTTPVAKGDGRKLLLRLNEKGLLDTEELR